MKALTKHREMIFNNLLERRDHPTAKMVFESTKDSGEKISFATVYNSLEFLVEQGLVKRLTVDPEVTRYDAILDTHSHLICDSCGLVQDIPALELCDSQPQVNWNGFEAQEIQITVRGVCKDCKS